MSEQALLILTTLPDASTAESIAERLIADGCAACVAIGSPVRSLYHWQGKIETAAEVPLTIKASASSYSAIEATIRTLHPYELPEIIAVPITSGLQPYLDWIADTCNRSAQSSDA